MFLVPSMLVYNPKAVPVTQKDDIILIYYFPDKFVPENVFNSECWWTWFLGASFKVIMSTGIQCS